jgi:hypothetical protein
MFIVEIANRRSKFEVLQQISFGSVPQQLSVTKKVKLSRGAV